MQSRVGEFETVAMHLVGPTEFHLERPCGLCPKSFEHVSKLVEDINGKQNKINSRCCTKLTTSLLFQQKNGKH